MSIFVCVYNDVPDEQPQETRGFWYTIGRTVPIHGFIFSHRGDD